MRSWVLVGVALLWTMSSAQTILKDPNQERYVAFWKSIGSGYNATWKAAAKIPPRKPVDDLQASLLASAYFYAHISGCGGPG